MGNLPRPRGVVPATPEMAGDMADRLAFEHVREVADVCGMHARDALFLSLGESAEAYGFVPAAGDGAVFMMGVGRKSVIGGAAPVWMLGTPERRLHPAGVLRAARWGVRRAFAVTGAELLEQYIPDWYTAGLAFVRRLGFVLSAADFRGRDGSRLWRAARYAQERPAGGGPARGRK